MSEPLTEAQIKDALAKAIGGALARATVTEDDCDEYVDWSEWHNCDACPREGQCACSGTAYARPEIVNAAFDVIRDLFA